MYRNRDKSLKDQFIANCIIALANYTANLVFAALQKWDSSHILSFLLNNELIPKQQYGFNPSYITLLCMHDACKE